MARKFKLPEMPCQLGSKQVGQAAKTEQLEKAVATATSAFDQLKAEIQADHAYAWAWHCNVAMPILDHCHGALTHRQANELAAEVMQHMFGIDVRSLDEWRSSEANWGAGFAPNGEG